MYDMQTTLMAQDYFELAYELQLQGEYDQAMYYYGRSLDLIPTAEAYTFMAWTESMRHRYEQAIALCHKATQVNASFGNAWNDWGAYLLALDRPNEAIPYLEEALRVSNYITPHYAHFNLGQAYEKLGNLEQARKKYQDALSVQFDYAPAREALKRLRSL